MTYIKLKKGTFSLKTGGVCRVRLPEVKLDCAILVVQITQNKACSILVFQMFHFLVYSKIEKLVVKARYNWFKLTL